MAKVEIRIDKIDINVDSFKSELNSKIHSWLMAIGSDAASTAQGVTPVDTGRLKNSIYPVVDTERSVQVGSNVEYAKYVELGARGREGVHMIQFGCTAHADQYKQMLEDALKE